MFRRLPIMPLTFAVTLGLFALTSTLLAQPPLPAKTDAKPDIKPDDIKRTQEENAKLYKRFAEELLRLAQRWEKSDNPDERDRAKALRSALKLAEEKGVKNLFDDILKGLGTNNPTGSDFNRIIGNDKKLVDALQEILNALETEDEADKIKREIAELKELIKEIEEHKRDQENIRARTDNPRGDREKIAQDQKELAKRTDDTAKRFPGAEKKDGGASGKDGKDDKAEAKPEAKPGESAPEAKPDTGENKASDKNNMGGMPSPMGGDPKPSPMGGMPSDGDKPSPKDGMGAGEPKPGEPKPMAGMNPMDPKPSDPKPGDSKAQGDGKGEPKPSEGMPGGDGKPMSGQPSPPMGGSPSQSKPSGGGGQPPMGGGQPPMGGKPKDQAQENVEQAVPQQKGAEEDIRKGDQPEAGKKQDKAIEELEKALKELEKRLKQLREKELEKLLANLEERVGRMLRMQIEVYEATKKIDTDVLKNKGQKTTADIQKSQSEADKEQTIVAEADKALKLMEGEGSAVVFAGVLNQVKGDMEAVQKRLNEGRVEKQTQMIEEDIIEQLTMMKEALKKAKQELQNQQSKPPGDPNSGGKPNNKLIDLINELKLIKALQEQVNKRTVGYSKQDPGEQAKDSLIQGELKQLSERQKVLQEMLHKIATQANQ